MIADAAIVVSLAALAAVAIVAVRAEQSRIRVPVTPARVAGTRVRLLPLHDTFEEAS